MIKADTRLRLEIRKALIELNQNSGDGNEQVHAFRKKLKELRAFIRLLDSNWVKNKHFNFVLRDLSRMISPLRDGLIYLETLDKVLVTKNLNTTHFEKLKNELREAYEIEYQKIIIDEDMLGKISKFLKENFSLPEDYYNAPIPMKSIHKSLRRLYSKSRDLWKNDFDAYTDDDLHEFRKRCKYLMYALRSIASYNPFFINILAANLDDLTEELGLDRDLYNLSNMVNKNKMLVEDANRYQLLSAISEMRKVHQEQIVPLSELIFLYRPKKLVKKLFTLKTTPD